MINKYLSDIGHLRSHHWKYWLDVYHNCGFDCKYCVYRIGEKMGKISGAISSEEELKRSLIETAPSGILYLGPKADIYQPKDASTKLTRGVLSMLCEYRVPVFTVTRSKLALRDRDIMQEMCKNGRLEVSVTIASAKEIQTLEPNTPSVKERLELVETLRRSGVNVSVHMSPIIPHLDTIPELFELMSRCTDAGAECIYACMLGMSETYASLVQSSLATHNKGLDVDSAYSDADKTQEVYSANGDYIVSLMERLRDFSEHKSIPFACVHLPEYDTIERNGGIFRFKIPTVGDICRHFTRRGKNTILWDDLAAYLAGFPAVDPQVQQAIKEFWEEDALFRNTYFHKSATGRSYSRSTVLDLKITNMKVGQKPQSIKIARSH